MLSLTQTFRLYKNLGSKFNLLLDCALLMFMPDIKCSTESLLIHPYDTLNIGAIENFKREFTSIYSKKYKDSLRSMSGIVIELLLVHSGHVLWLKCKHYANYEIRSPMERRLQLYTHPFPGLPLCVLQLWTLTLLPDTTCH